MVRHLWWECATGPEKSAPWWARASSSKEQQGWGEGDYLPEHLSQAPERPKGRNEEGREARAGGQQGLESLSRAFLRGKQEPPPRPTEAFLKSMHGVNFPFFLVNYFPRGRKTLANAKILKFLKFEDCLVRGPCLLDTVATHRHTTSHT